MISQCIGVMKESNTHMKVCPTHFLLHGSMVTQNRGPWTISTSTQVPAETLRYRSYVINRALATRLVQ